MTSVADPALRQLAQALEAEGGLLAPHVVGDPFERGDRGALGKLVAAGPRVRGHENEYALVIEAVREGYLLHYGMPRILGGLDPDLALLAGDYLYALGLDRLAALDDPLAVALLGDLISLVALCHSERLEACVEPLWLATTIAVGCGVAPETETAMSALKALETASDQGLWRSAQIAARDSGISDALLVAAKAIDFPAVKDSNLG